MRHFRLAVPFDPRVNECLETATSVVVAKNLTRNSCTICVAIGKKYLIAPPFPQRLTYLWITQGTAGAGIRINHMASEFAE